MGHDITACRTSEPDAEVEEIAYLRRSAWDGNARKVYAALQCKECDCGFSGCGVMRTFTHDEIVSALSRLPLDDESERERNFLRACIAASGSLTIHFF